jgi:hypothetical protein
MKKLIKYLPLVIAVCAIADTQFEMLKGIGMNEALINWIKLLGLLLTIFLPSIKEMFNDGLSLRNTDPKNPNRPSTRPKPRL